MIKFRSEAGRSTGTVKRKGSLAKMTNFGYYLDDDKAFIARCEEALAKAEVSEDLANKIAAAKEALEKEMEIEPVDMRSALNRLHSPLAKDDAEKEKIFKDSRSAVFLVRKAIYDTKLNGMVNTLTSKYASNAKRVLEDGIHTIEVTKGEMEKYGLTGDDVTAGLYSATTLSQSTKSKAVAEFIVKMRPQLEKAIDAVKAANAINASDLNAILLEMKDMFDEAQKDAEEIKYSVRTTIAAADKEDIDAIPQPDTLGESVQNEGVFSRLASWFSNIASKIRGFVDSILGLTDEANDEVDSLMALLEGVEESCKREGSALPLEDAVLAVSDLLKGRGYTERSADSWINVNMNRIQDMLDAGSSPEDIVYEIDGPLAESRNSEGSGAKAYTFTWWDNEPTAERRPTTRSDLKKCLHKEIFTAADDAEALELAMEYLCDYIGDDPENVADTPEEIWDYFDSDWGDGNPIPMVLKQGRSVVKDSGFDPNDVEESAAGSLVQTESKGREQVIRELQDILDLLREGGKYGEKAAISDARRAAEGTKWAEMVGNVCDIGPRILDPEDLIELLIKRVTEE